MQVTANVAVKNVAKAATSADTPSVKPNGPDAEQPMSFAEFEQRLEQKPDSDDAQADLEAQPQLVAGQPLPSQSLSAEDLAVQVEQLLGQVTSSGEAQLPQEGELSAEQLQAAAMTGQAMQIAQGASESGKVDLLEQMQRVIKQQVMPGANVVPQSKEAQLLANEAQLLGKEPLPLAKGAALPTNEVMLANKDMLTSVDSSLVDKLAATSLATPTIHVHSAMNGNLNMLTQAAMQPSATAASANTQAQQFQASVDITEPEWGRDLVEQLRSRMKLSKTDQIQHAHVRLDPPELGRLEVNLRMEGDKVSVHFTAAHPQLREALAANADRLRFDFDGSQMQLADVSVSSGMYQQSQQQSGSDDEPGVMSNHITQHEDTSSTSAPGLDGRYESMV
ncbi:flagellar hook-length control protein FliK [uncultured Photobacterium sp.]|uniref:flagellar hook-length control protein FliK n=1 Tax=uncultured Photobacterium sp. TaxID=173973 RepID=UPI002614E49D|nr:flagellar hook-length control protein FliK [uncultured Photobacterium sp.]